VSSDKGLCGGVHSSLSKLLRRTLIGPEATADPASPIVVIGDKAKAQLSRHLVKNFLLTVNQIGKDVPTFTDAAGVVDLVAQSGVQYDSVRPPVNFTGTRRNVDARGYRQSFYTTSMSRRLRTSR
jgi:F-type H+-transporting ATPase subunit gamma